VSNLLIDLKDYLIIYASDGNTDYGVDVFIDNLPDSPDNCTALLEYAGQVDFISNAVNRSIQIRVRNTDYQTAQDYINSIYNVLYNPESDIRIIDFTATRWGIVAARNYPYLLNRDDKNRCNFVFNLGIVTTGDS
jgi:hypothetical protein